MQIRKFIENQDLVKTMLKDLELIQNSTVDFDEIYIDRATNQKWEKYDFEFLDQITNGIGLRIYPYPTVKTIIEIAINSIYLDEVAGASALLFEKDRLGENVREELILKLTKNLNKVSKEYFEIIYWRTEFYSNTNERDTMNKKYSEVQEDYDFYIQTANRIKKLRKKVNSIL
ncbi:MAG: hypothetical protein ABJK28_05715 [Algibacter sp.]